MEKEYRPLVYICSAYSGNIEENTVYSEPDRIVMDLSEMKCRAVADKLSESYNEIKKIPENYDNILIVAADTMVSRGGVSLGKPKNKEDKSPEKTKSSQAEEECTKENFENLIETEKKL